MLEFAGEVAMAEEATEAVAEPATEFLDRIMSEKVKPYLFLSINFRSFVIDNL